MRTAAGWDEADVQRIRDLAIPPAWTNVWICTGANGHIQAVGTDAAGRRQYLYHPQWRTKRDAAKHDRARAGSSVPKARKLTASALRGDGLTRERVLATAFRMLDLGSFRIGSETYADQHDTYGLATIRREHVTIRRHSVTFRYLAKGSVDREQRVVDAALATALAELVARDDDDPELLAWYEANGRWHDVHSTDVNEHVHEVMRGEFTARIFLGTWNATASGAAAGVRGHGGNSSSAKEGRLRRLSDCCKISRQHCGCCKEFGMSTRVWWSSISMT